MNQRDYFAIEEARAFDRAMRISKRILLFWCVVIAACVLPTELPAPPLPFTPNPNMIIGIGSHGSPDEAAIMQRLGVKHVRVSYYMKNDSHLERQMFALRLVDLQLHDLTPLVVIPDADPRNIAPIVSFARQMRATIQVGNEWDAQDYTGTFYAKLMRAITDSVDASQFVGMGLASTDGQAWSKTPDALRQAKFWRDYFVANGPSLRAYAIHCYGADLAAAVRTRVLATSFELPTGAELWITETGTDDVWMQRTGYDGRAAFDTVQSLQAMRAINAARNAGVTRLYFFQLWDNTDEGFGFLRADARTTRPVFDAVREAIGGAR